MFRGFLLLNQRCYLPYLSPCWICRLCWPPVYCAKWCNSWGLIFLIRLGLWPLKLGSSPLSVFVHILSHSTIAVTKRTLCQHWLVQSTSYLFISNLLISVWSDILQANSIFSNYLHWADTLEFPTNYNSKIIHQCVKRASIWSKRYGDFPRVLT